MILATILKKDNRLLCQFGAGKGKSRVIAALAFLFLQLNKQEIYLVYSNNGLMRRDMKQCEDLWAFAGAANEKQMNRLHHIVGVDGLPTNK